MEGFRKLHLEDNELTELKERKEELVEELGKVSEQLKVSSKDLLMAEVTYHRWSIHQEILKQAGTRSIKLGEEDEKISIEDLSK